MSAGKRWWRNLCDITLKVLSHRITAPLLLLLLLLSDVGVVTGGWPGPGPGGAGATQDEVWQHRQRGNGESTTVCA